MTCTHIPSDLKKYIMTFVTISREQAKLLFDQCVIDVSIIGEITCGETATEVREMCGFVADLRRADQYHQMRVKDPQNRNAVQMAIRHVNAYLSRNWGRDVLFAWDLASCTPIIERAV